MAFKFTIPDKYEDITVGQFFQYKSAKNDIEKLMAIGNITRDEASAIKMSDVKIIIDLFEKVLTLETVSFKPVVQVGSRKYGFIPNLYHITAGEYADIIDYCKDINTNIVKLLGVLYRPVLTHIGDKYSIESYDVLKRELYQKDIETFPMEYFGGAMLFFSTLANELSNTSLESLRQQITETTKEVITLMKEA